MENEEKSSKLETILGVGTGVGFAAVFNYNFYQALDKLGYFDMFKDIALNDFGEIKDPATHEKVLSIMHNVAWTNIFGTSAILIGGIYLGSYMGKKIQGHILKKREVRQSEFYRD